MHGEGCTCDNLADTPGSVWLYGNINNVTVQNTSDGSYNKRKELIRAHTQRFNKNLFFTSDIAKCKKHVIQVNVSFILPCNLVAIYLLCDDWPDQMHLFCNMGSMDFDRYDSRKANQTLQIVQDPCGNTPHPLYVGAFKNRVSLSIIFDSTKPFTINYIGFKGVTQEPLKNQVIYTVYEVMPNLEDHEVDNKVYSKLIV